jgi:hypothetical protein
MKKSIAYILFAILGFAPLSDAAAEATASKKVIINGTQLAAKDIQSLERSYGVPLQSGRYWYDRMSGLWGYEGQPTNGQIYAGLQLGGPLKANASNGKTGVFINGRELPIIEVQYLQQLGTVYKGRYWMNALGVGGIEGGPAIFDLGAASRQRSGGGLYGGNSRTTPFGHIGSDGKCSYFFDPKSGSSVMSGNCN